jgi:4-aminobutyrate aminotransferase-like enzyme
VEAIRRQASLLNTNTRYLHDNLVRYAERLAATLPAPLEVCYFVNSASEANELALRLARAHTGRRQLVVLRDAYHGHTTTLVDVSSYKFAGPGGSGPPPWVHVAPVPDLYRGAHRREDPQACAHYVADFGSVVDTAARGGLSGFLAETVPSVAGQIVLPDGYLQAAYRAVRRSGGLCIADEVQVGFGRLGSHFWGFEMQSVVPDIVVLGKPMGNAHPLAAVVTTREIAASFDNGMEFFSSFGGNPVSCAAGMAVLDVLQSEQLQANAHRVGMHLLEELRRLQTRHPLIGEVRGRGLFLGIELVTDRELLTPASDQTAYVVRRLRERGVLAGIDGPLRNVIKLRPPMVIGVEDADLFVERLDAVLGEEGAAPG